MSLSQDNTQIAAGRRLRTIQHEMHGLVGACLPASPELRRPRSSSATQGDQPGLHKAVQKKEDEEEKESQRRGG